MVSRPPTETTHLPHNGLPRFGQVIDHSQHALRGMLRRLFGWQAPAELGQIPKVTMADIAGLDEAKSELQEALGNLRTVLAGQAPYARSQRGILLTGAPGTGKTSLIEALANEANLPLWRVSVAGLVVESGSKGQPAHLLHDLFRRARNTAKAGLPAILLIDDLDAPDVPGTAEIYPHVTAVLRAEIDLALKGQARQPILLLAAARRPDLLDPTLLRPGRLEQQIIIGLPDRQTRASILSVHTRRMHLATNVNLGVIARTTTGFNGADLAYLCSRAEACAERKHHERVSMADFEEALDQFLLDSARSLVLNDQERRLSACHEAGHALAAWLIPAADPIQHLTLMPKSWPTSSSAAISGEEHPTYSKEYLLARLSTLLAGRAAENVLIHEITTAAEDDLREATRLASRMITRWGMGQLGPMAMGVDRLDSGGSPEPVHNISEQTAARIDQEVQELLTGQYEYVSQLLSGASQDLENLTSALLEEESLDHEDLIRILGPRPVDIAGGTGEMDLPGS